MHSRDTKTEKRKYGYIDTLTFSYLSLKHCKEKPLVISKNALNSRVQDDTA